MPLRLLALLCVTLAMVFNTGSAAGQTPTDPPATITGVLKAVDGSTLTIEVDDGNTMSVRLIRKTRILRGTAKAKPADLKPGDNLSADVVYAPDGRLEALVVRITPSE